MVMRSTPFTHVLTSSHSQLGLQPRFYGTCRELNRCRITIDPQPTYDGFGLITEVAEVPERFSFVYVCDVDLDEGDVNAT